MTDPQGEAVPALDPIAEAERRRRLAEIFGDVVPEQTREDIVDPSDPGHDEWLRRQVPPHHG